MTFQLFCAIGALIAICVLVWWARTAGYRERLPDTADDTDWLQEFSRG